MAIAEVQAFISVSSSGSPLTKTYASTPTQGNLLIAVAAGSTVIANASISGWNAASISALRGATATLAIFYKVAGAGESKDVVLTWTGSTATYLGIAEYSGLSATPLDKTAKTDSTGSGVTSRSSGTTAITAVANELCVACVQTGDTTSAQSWSNSYVAKVAIANQFFASALIVSSAGAQESTLSWTTSRFAGGCIATFAMASSLAIPVFMNQYRQRSN